MQTTSRSKASGSENRIASAFARARDVYGGNTPGLRVRVRSEIPMRAGLGSSAAASVAGLRLYESVTAERPVSDWLRLGSELEGHPDNAAAALLVVGKANSLREAVALAAEAIDSGKAKAVLDALVELSHAKV